MLFSFISLGNLNQNLNNKVVRLDFGILIEN